MAKHKLTYIFILASLFVFYVGSQLFRPKDTDWSLNFGKNSKSPFGCYILRNKLPELISGISVSENSMDLYNSLTELNQNSSTLCIITDHFKPDKPDLNSLLRYVENGNIAFISAESFDGLLGDTLKIKLTYNIYKPLDLINKLSLQLVNPNISKPRTFIYKNISPNFFTRLDTSKSTILEKDSSGSVTYIKTKFGKGFFFLHANPLVFTNYHILYNSAEYPFKSLAYLANRPLIWDEYYKPGFMAMGGGSPLRYILSQESLRYAYILFVITWIIFVFFVGKRKQKIIPIYEKPQNQSLDFIETVGQLYYNQHNNSDIIQKKIAYFADYVHSVFYLKFQPEDVIFRKNFATKANISIVRVNKLFNALMKLQRAEKLSDSQLMNFMIEIDQFQYQNQLIIKK